jgi:class 3 adenylate cyclase
MQGPDYPDGGTPELKALFETYLRDMWGQGLGAYIAAPSRADDEAFRRWFGRYERLAVSPGEGLSMFEVNLEIDARHLLPTIRVPTLILHQTGDRLVPVELGRYMAERIPDAKFVELPGMDHLFWFGDPDPLVDEIQEFLLGVRPMREPDRVLATIMFTDIVSSTERAASLGDKKWRDLLGRCMAATSKQVAQFRGREIKSMGDGLLATFDGPARAVRCGFALREAARELGIQLRTGIHTGEVELIGEDVGGIAVHICARVAGLAEPNEVLASSTVKDLVAGSGIRFAERGTHQLKGIPEEWRLFAAEE